PEALGFSAAEIQAPGWWESQVHPDDLPQALANRPILFATGRLTHEYRIRAKDGHYLWILDQVVLLRDEVGVPSGALGAWFDITDRKRVEQELQAARARY